MPKPITYILLEKKEKLEFNYSEFYDTIKNLDSILMNIISDISAINSLGGDVFKSGGLEELDAQCKKDLDLIRKWQKEWKKYSWSDPKMQRDLKKIRERVIEDSKKIAETRKKGREEVLGKNDSLRGADAYFSTAESLREKATAKLLEVSTIRAQDIRTSKIQDNTDLLAANKFDTDKIDLVAKKDGKRSNETDDAYNKRIKDADDNTDRVREGMFSYLANILGLTAKEIKKKWMDEGEEKDKIAARKDYLKRALPFIEKASGRTYNQTAPWEDKEYLEVLKNLSQYSPGFTNYKPKKESKASKEITEAERIKIAEKGGVIVNNIKTSLGELAKINSGTGAKEKAVQDEIKKNEAKINNVDLRTCCDIAVMDSLYNTKEEIEKNIQNNQKFLSDADKKLLEDVIDEITKMMQYCNGEKYKE